LNSGKTVATLNKLKKSLADELRKKEAIDRDNAQKKFKYEGTKKDISKARK